MTLRMGTEGQKFDNRFIVPHGIDEKELCLFSIIDLTELGSRGSEADLYWRAQGFGVSWNENSAKFTQVFGYRVATIREMELLGAMKGHDDGGFVYVCYKTPLQSNTRKFLPSSSGEHVEFLGWRYHPSHYIIYAKEDASAVTFFHAKRFGEEVGKRIGRSLEILIPEKEITQSMGIMTRDFFLEDAVLNPITQRMRSLPQNGLFLP